MKSKVIMLSAIVLAALAIVFDIIMCTVSAATVWGILIVLCLLGFTAALGVAMYSSK